MPELTKRFVYHPPKGDQPARYEQVRRHTLDLAVEFTTLCPESIELTRALVKLEEAVIWANAAIARNE